MLKKIRLSKSDEALIPDDRTESSPGRTLDRVYAALRGEFDADQLEPDEVRIFEDLLIDYMAGPNPERDAFVAKMHAEGGYVGEEDPGRLVRTLLGGWCGNHRGFDQDLISTEGIGPLQGLKPTLCTSRSPRPLPWPH